jgi:protein-disulfide isomerase
MIDLDYQDIPQHRTEDGAFILGQPDAPVTIVAFEDLLCPHCKSYQSTLNTFIEDYVIPGKARLEYRLLPVHGDDSIFAYSLVICAAEKNTHFWKAVETMFQIAGGDESLNKEQAHTFADELEFTDIRLTTCASENEQFRIDAVLATANEINATPTIAARDADDNLDTDILPRQPDLDALRHVVESHTGS